jgi:hypothetical protein
MEMMPVVNGKSLEKSGRRVNLVLRVGIDSSSRHEEQKAAS